MVKDIVYLTQEQWETLQTEGVIYIDGEEYLYNENNDYRVKMEPSVASHLPSSGGAKPNVLYSLGSITADPNITLATPADPNVVNEYMFLFTVGSGWTPAVTFPSSVIFPETPTWEVGKTYQVSILNNLALVAVWGATA